MRTGWMLVLLLAACGEGGDGPTPPAGSGDGDVPDGGVGGGAPGQDYCDGRLTNVEGFDLCGVAALTVPGASPDGSVVDVGLTLGTSICTVALDLQDVCGAGRHWVRGGAEATWDFTACGGAVSTAERGWVEVNAVSITPVDGSWFVELDATIAVADEGDTVLEGGVVIGRTVAIPAFGPGDEGCAAQPRVESSEIAAAPLDVLFVLDDSCSMDRKQGKLARAGAQLLAVLDELSESWRIGAVTTDMQSASRRGELLTTGDGSRWLDADASVAAFQELVDVGTAGWAEERPFRAMVTALGAGGTTAPSVNEDFVREGAALEIVVLTDEEDHTSGMTPMEVHQALDDRFPDRSVTVSAIAGPVPDGCGDWNDFDQNGGEPAERVAALVDATGGSFVDICDGDYATVFDHVEVGAGTRIVPEMLPILPSLEVYRGSAVAQAGLLQRGGDWRWDDATGAVVLDGARVRDEGIERVTLSYVPARR